MNISNLIESASSYFDPILNLLTSSNNDENSHMEVITGIAVGALTLVAAGALLYRRSLTEVIPQGPTSTAVSTEDGHFGSVNPEAYRSVFPSR